jgi:hypothetical protein
MLMKKCFYLLKIFVVFTDANLDLSRKLKENIHFKPRGAIDYFSVGEVQ